MMKPKGKKSAYICFSQEFRNNYKNENPDDKSTFAELSKTCGQMWKTMSDEDKKKYFDMSFLDKERYVKDMENCVFDEKDNEKLKKKKKRRATKDPNEPKRPWSAYFYFCDEHRKDVREQNPEFKLTDVAKALGKMWSECTEKHIYEEKSLKAKEVYKKELEEYLTTEPNTKKLKLGENSSNSHSHYSENESD